MFSFSKKKLIGLDIGTSTIKAAELDVSRKSASLVSYGMIPTPPQATVAGDIIDPQAIGGAVRELMTEIKTKRNFVATGLWGSSVIVKRISIPRMDENLVAEQIRWEAEQYIPYDINEVNLEFTILKKATPSNPETMDVLLVAAVQEMILKCAEIVELAGLNCSVLDVEGFALANCFEKNYGELHGQAVGLLNIGASVSNFVVVENGEVIFCRDIPVGGGTYTTEIQKGLNITAEEAEAMKISACTGQPAPEEASAIIQSTHEIILDELNNSVEFFLNTSQSSKISRLFLSGGALRTPGLQQLIGKTYTSERFDPFLKIRTNEKVFSAAYLDEIRDFAAVAIGLGLREVNE